MLHLQTSPLCKKRIFNSLHQSLIFVLTPQQEKLAQEIFCNCQIVSSPKEKNTALFTLSRSLILPFSALRFKTEQQSMPFWRIFILVSMLILWSQDLSRKPSRNLLLAVKELLLTQVMTNELYTLKCLFPCLDTLH